MEDDALYSLSYLHAGAPKRWYFLPSNDVEKFEKFMLDFSLDYYKGCPAFLSHKVGICNPDLLVKKNTIAKYNKVLQEEGDIIVTFSYAYHTGYNLNDNSLLNY